MNSQEKKEINVNSIFCNFMSEANSVIMQQSHKSKRNKHRKDGL